MMDAPLLPDTWLIADFEAGLCSKEQVGGPREPVAPVEIAPLDKKETLRPRLAADALQAYHDLGGVEYLKANPELLNKILQRAIAPEPLLKANVFQFPEMPWLTQQRLSYAQKLEIAEDIKIKPTPPDEPAD